MRNGQGPLEGHLVEPRLLKGEWKHSPRLGNLCGEG